MRIYNVTCWIVNQYGGFYTEQKQFRALNLEALYELLKTKGYKNYFIGSLSGPAYEN